MIFPVQIICDWHKKLTQIMLTFGEKNVTLHRSIVLCGIRASALCETITNNDLLGNESSWSRNEIKENESLRK